MANCGGMGMTLEHYPPAPAVLAFRAGLDPTNDFFTWFVDHVAARLHLRV
jgi:hypothetical protein